MFSTMIEVRFSAVPSMVVSLPVVVDTGRTYNMKCRDEHAASTTGRSETPGAAWLKDMRPIAAHC